MRRAKKVLFGIIHIFIIFVFSNLWIIFGAENKELFFDGTLLYIYFLYVNAKPEKSIFDKFIIALIMWNMLGDIQFFSLIQYIGAGILIVFLIYNLYFYERNRNSRKNGHKELTD